jgi:hypothetical protein
MSGAIALHVRPGPPIFLVEQTSVPAWRAGVVRRACPWSGVATITASTSLRSRTRRKSLCRSTGPPKSGGRDGTRQVRSLKWG